MDSKTHALLIALDRSGSMSALAGEMRVALQTLIDEQAAKPEFVVVDLFQFDNVIEKVYEMQDAKDVKVELDPRGGTALYDALGVSINSFFSDIEKLPPHSTPSSFTLVCISDGLDNCSAEYSRETVRQLIEQKREKYGLETVFLGANQDAILTGKGLGFQEDASLTFDPNANGVSAMAQSASRFIQDARSGKRQGFTPDERGASSKRYS